MPFHGYVGLGGINSAEAIESFMEPAPQSSAGWPGCVRVLEDDPQLFPALTTQLIFFAPQPDLLDRPELVRMEFAHRPCPFGVHIEQEKGYAVPALLGKRRQRGLWG